MIEDINFTNKQKEQVEIMLSPLNDAFTIYVNDDCVTLDGQSFYFKSWGEFIVFQSGIKYVLRQKTDLVK